MEIFDKVCVAALICLMILLSYASIDVLKVDTKTNVYKIVTGMR